MKKVDLLIAGGINDPNIATLATAAHAIGCAAKVLTYGDDSEPSVSWELSSDAFLVNGEEVKPRAAFLRQDVFSYRDMLEADRLDKGMAWHAALFGLCLSDRSLHLLNREIDYRTGSKPAMLKLAAAHGLPIPDTLISNDEDAVGSMNAGKEIIAKPVAGGAYCLTMKEVMANSPWRQGVAAAPAIVQQQLSYPEYRVYIIGSELLVFQLSSESVDYRIDNDCRIECVSNETLPKEIRDGLLSLSSDVKLDFGAADLKTDPEGDRICFLELNNQPMFAAHDKVCNGALSRLIVDELLQ